MSNPGPDALPASAVRAFRLGLPRWFRRHRRELPWRVDRSAYRVWVSELMLQQTRVDTVIPYFERFVRRWPSVEALADAEIGDVLKMWEGLGYYSRARNLHRAARFVRAERGGRLPATLREWRDLPGVGPYTAAAISSLALGLDHAVVDGNVIRVVCRYFGLALPAKAPATRDEVQARVDALLPPGRAGEFNEAMMELGALVCAPRTPACSDCPLRAGCAAHRAGDPGLFPVRAAPRALPLVRVGAAVTLGSRNRLLIAQRRPEGLLGGLWEFPGGKIREGEDFAACVRRELREELAIEVETGPELLVVRHTYSHFRLEMHVLAARWVSGRPRAVECAAFRWTDLPGLRSLPFSRADLHVIDWLERHPGRLAELAPPARRR